MRRDLAAVFILTGTIASACNTGSQRNVVPSPSAVGVQADSLSSANARLYALVRAVDRAGRVSGSLPVTLGDLDRDLAGSLLDPWGRTISYSAAGRDFSIRSAGRDGALHTADDVVATGRLGRAIPCELRDETQTSHYERVAPPCGDAPVERLYPLCPLLERADRIERGIPKTGPDSVRAMGRRLVRVARAIDGYGREIGILPRNLRGSIIWDRTDSGDLLDLWGRVVRYRPENDKFELRSAGPDGALDSADDIVVHATLGAVIPCRFGTLTGDERCEEPPPDCAERSSG